MRRMLLSTLILVVLAFLIPACSSGESEEAAIVVGNPEDSPLMWAVMWEGMEMPPKENDRLSEEQIEWLHRWIKAGAPWPSEQQQAAIMKTEQLVEENEDGVLISTSGGLAGLPSPRHTWVRRPASLYA